MTGRRLVLPMLALLLSAGCVVGGEVPVDGGAPAASDPPPADSGEATGEDQMARDIFERVNDERAERGLAPVAWNEQLAGVARSWSAEMAQRGTLEHQDVRALLQGDEVSGFTSLGENIFTATGSVPAGVIHVGWMRSDSHRPNVLNPGWDRLGVGVHCAEDGSVWATQEFGRTTGSDRPPVSEKTPPQDPIVRSERDGPTCGG
jgi:uncharacterized protein YkwD